MNNETIQDISHNVNLLRGLIDDFIIYSKRYNDDILDRTSQEAKESISSIEQGIGILSQMAFEKELNSSSLANNSATAKGNGMYNLKKSASKVYEKHLRDNDSSLENQDHSGITDWQLGNDDEPGKRRTDKKSLDTQEGQLSKSRSGCTNEIVEKSLDGKKLYNDKRYPNSYETSMNHASNRVAEAHDQKRLREFKEEQEKGTQPDVGKDPGSQIIGKKTKVVKNKQDSQLQNHPDRMKGMDKKMPIESDYQSNLSALKKKESIKQMVMASIKDADAMLFHIFAKASSESRELKDSEYQMINDINSSKARALRFFEEAS